MEYILFDPLAEKRFLPEAGSPVRDRIRTVLDSIELLSRNCCGATISGRYVLAGYIDGELVKPEDDDPIDLNIFVKPNADDVLLGETDEGNDTLVSYPLRARSRIMRPLQRTMREVASTYGISYANRLSDHIRIYPLNEELITRYMDNLHHHAISFGVDGITIPVVLRSLFHLGVGRNTKDLLRLYRRHVIESFEKIEDSEVREALFYAFMITVARAEGRGLPTALLQRRLALYPFSIADARRVYQL